MSKIKAISPLIIVSTIIFSISAIAEERLDYQVTVKDIKFLKPLGVQKDLYDFISDNYKANHLSNKEDLNSGANLSYVDPSCNPQTVEDNILKNSESNTEMYKTFNEYFNRCGEKLSKGSVKGLAGLMRFASTEYKFFENPKVQKVVIELSNNKLIPGVLALKDSTTPRPFVVFRCGVFCSAVESASMKNYMMNFFDQSPFNVLFLANNTGLDYIQLNKKFTFGGEAEGPETIAIGNWVKNQSPFKNIVSSLHMSGASLGGNAAIFTSYYNNQLRDIRGEKIFKSVTAICPVLDLQDSMNLLYQNGTVWNMYKNGNGVLVSNGAAAATKNQLNSGKSYFEDIGDLLDQSPPPSKTKMKDYLGWLASESLTRAGAPTTPKEFWDANSYFKRMPISIDTPTLVFASKDDHIVNNAANTGKLKKLLKSNFKDSLGILNLPYGDHCGFNSVYGTNATSMILRSFVLHDSPEYTARNYLKMKLPWLLSKVDVTSYEVNLSQTFEFSEKSNHVDIHFKVFNKLGNLGSCYLSDPFSPVVGCVIDKKVSINIQNLKFLGARVPTNKVEAEALSREFNAKIQFVTNNGLLNGTSSPAEGIIYRTW